MPWNTKSLLRELLVPSNGSDMGLLHARNHALEWGDRGVEEGPLLSPGKWTPNFACQDAEICFERARIRQWRVKNWERDASLRDEVHTCCALFFLKYGSGYIARYMLCRHRVCATECLYCRQQCNFPN